MADPQKETAPTTPAFSEQDMARARQWFAKAADCRERREYDYAVECYITGLGYWPDAVDEGHMPLRSLAIQRQQAGGKKPGFLDSVKKSMTGKDALRAMLNAEHLLAMDPHNPQYAEGVLRNAVRAGLLQTAKWVAPLLFDLLKRDKKPNKARFDNFRKLLVEAAQAAGERRENALETWFLEQAVSSLEYLTARLPTDEALRDELRDLGGRLTIARGKYEEAEDFRESLYEADKQKLLHDSERSRQADESLAAVIEARRREHEAAPDVPGKVFDYVDALLKAERKEEEDRAIEVLMKAYERSRNYSFKLRADDIRLNQLRRRTSRLLAKARQTHTDEDKQQARLAALEQRQTELEIFRERVQKYPTDLRLKFKLGEALFKAGEYDEAIPVLQLAQQDPRNRIQCQLLLGRAFFEKGSPNQTVELLTEALDKYELVDEQSKEILYWLGRAQEALGRVDDAKATYGKLLRQDYNYRDGDARKRLESLK